MRDIHLCLIPYFRRISFNFFVFIIMFAVDLLLHFLSWKYADICQRSFLHSLGWLCNFCLYIYLYVMLYLLICICWDILSSLEENQFNWLVLFLLAEWLAPAGFCDCFHLGTQQWNHQVQRASPSLLNNFFNRLREREIHWLQSCSHWWPSKALVDNSNPGIP